MSRMLPGLTPDKIVIFGLSTQRNLMFFTDPVIFEIPVLPRVQKFVLGKLAQAAGRPAPLLADPTAYGPGQYLWTMAQTEKKLLFSNYAYRPGGKNRPPASRITYDTSRYSVQLGVGIQALHPSRERQLLNYLEVEMWSNYVDHLIRNELVQYCEKYPGVPPMVRIKSFTDQYDFSEEDFSEDSLKQLYLRHRKGKTGATYIPQVSQQIQYVPVTMAA